MTYSLGSSIHITINSNVFISTSYFTECFTNIVAKAEYIKPYFKIMLTFHFHLLRKLKGFLNFVELPVNFFFLHSFILNIFPSLSTEEKSKPRSIIKYCINLSHASTEFSASTLNFDENPYFNLYPPIHNYNHYTHTIS